MPTMAAKIEQTKEALSSALQSDEMRPLQAFLPKSSSELLAWSATFWDTRKFPAAAASQLHAADQSSPPKHLPYRYLLLSNSLLSLERLRELPLDDGVKQLMCDEYSAFASADPEWLHLFDPKEYSFRALVGISLCRRFRAGLLDWEDAGFPRSWFARLPRKDLLRTIRFLLFRMGGRQHFWFPHNAFLRGKVQFMREREWEASLLLMAESMRLQPQIKGIITGSWFYSPETHRVTPHLGWTTRIFLENGALMTNIGPADPGAGFIQGSKEREQLYQSGQYRPTETILLWARKDVLNWLTNRPVKPAKR